MPDPRWLEILKAGGWQLLATCVACVTFLLLDHWGTIPPLENWIVLLLLFAGLLTGLLTAVAIISSILKFLTPWLLHFINQHRHRKAARNYIPNMQGREKEIIAHLLHHNQKTFIGAADGGYAMPLIANGIVVSAMVAGQVVDIENVPFRVPDHIWNELKKHSDQFPYMADDEPHEAGHPWRIHWMAR